MGRRPGTGIRGLRHLLACERIQAAQAHEITYAKETASRPREVERSNMRHMRERAAWVVAVQGGLDPFAAFLAAGVKMRRCSIAQGKVSWRPPHCLATERAKVEVWCQRVTAVGVIDFIRIGPRHRLAKTLFVGDLGIRNHKNPHARRRAFCRDTNMPLFDADLIAIGKEWMIYDTSELGDFDPHTCHLPPGGHPCE